MYDTEGITSAVVHTTIRLDPADIRQPRDELERAIIDDAAYKYFDATSHVEFITGAGA